MHQGGYVPGKVDPESAPARALPGEQIVPMRPTCGAALPARHDPGWTCDGARLVTILAENGPLMSGLDGVPVVIREDLVWLADRLIRDLIRRYGTRPFEGGNHTHLVVRTD